MNYLWLVGVGYLAGSIPWGLLIVRTLRGVDVRSYGSGRTGMTNVMRTAGRPAAVAALAADVGKGVGMVVVAKTLTPDAAIHAAVAGAVVVGHVWPVFAGFRGGRGIATGVGTAGMLDPLGAAIGFLMVFVPIVGVTRYVSLGSVLAVVAVVVVFTVKAAIGELPIPYLWYVLVVGGLIIWMHRDNIQRLRAGTERKLKSRTEE